jgi:anthranilate/para-aminobenzoate synthase component I
MTFFHTDLWHLKPDTDTTLWSLLYLQAGGGIVFDSVPSDEYTETLNKLGATMAAVKVRYRL